MESKIVTLNWIKLNSTYSGDYWVGILPNCKQCIFHIGFVDFENKNTKYQIFGRILVEPNFLGFSGNQGYKKFGSFESLEEAKEKCQQVFEQAVKENFLQ